MDDKLFKNKYRIPTVRATWHDYNSGMYFVTICTAGHEHYFGEITDGEMHLSALGQFTQACIRNIDARHDGVAIPLFQIMPNHIHMIVDITSTPPVEPSPRGGSDSNNAPRRDEPPRSDGSTDDTINEPPRSDGSTRMRAIANSCGRLSHMVSRLKSYVTRHARTNGLPFAWQTRFHDRIIRDTEEMNGIAAYIENNVLQWDADTENQRP